ncbi:unnamed protein product [Rhizophagus irregularis]|nr:unnamed protein product [Rhizophagus irregularis]CAB5371467.1 unnamed protein product [Rhizophagus irregularis]
MGTKYTLKDVNAIAMERGGICISKEYINFRSLMKWRCAKGYEWQARFPCIKTRKRWCPHCAGNAPHTIEEARQIASSKNGQCLSEKYANSSSPLLWKCSKGHEWYKSLYHVKNCDAWCPECCKISQKLDPARDFALSKRGVCLSEKYINNKSLLKWKCAKGHEWQASFKNVKNNNTWCPHCAKRGLKHNIEFAKSLAYKRNGNCLSEEYIDTNEPLLWSCAECHEWNASLHSIQRGSWYPHCSKYQRENRCREIVAKYLGPPSKIRRPDFLKTLEYPKGLELDIPYYDHGFAIEVQGEQHVKYIEFFHRGDPNNFIKQQDRDQLKKNLCEESNIYLFYIWYNDKDPEKTIRQELHALGLID